MQSEDFFLPTSVGQIAVKVWNKDLTQNVIALHGWLDNLAAFEPLAASLPHLRLHACDLPGHGWSSHRSEGGVYHIIDSAYDLYSIIEALGWKKVHLIGHSMGAAVAMLFAAAAPHIVESLVLLEGLGPLSASPADMIDRLQTHLRQRRRLIAKRFPVYRTKDEALEARVIAADISRDAARWIVERGLKEVPGGWTWRTDARLRIRSAHPFSEEQVQALIGTIQCPALFVRARPGFPFGEELLEGRMRCLKQLECHVLSGNHHLHMDKPKEVASLIEDFYGRFG